MDLLSIIGTVIEFSEKGEEYSDEIKAFKATLESLQLTVKHVEPRDMPSHLSGMLNDNLEEAKELLNKAGNASNGSWLTNIRNMLPGSHLQKIKEKNQQLVHIITLINLHLNSIKSSKRNLETALTTNFDDDEPALLKKQHTMQPISSRTSLNMPRKSASESTADLYGPTLDTNGDEDDRPDLQGATQADNPDENMEQEDPAFRLRIIYDERLGKVLSKCKDFEAFIEKRWDGLTQVEYIFQRLNFAYLPMEDCSKISRDHALVIAIKKAMGGNKGVAGMSKEDLAVTATVPDDDKLYGATMVDDGEGEGNANGATDGPQENEFILKDLSLNGTYYLKRGDLLNFPASGMKIKGDFKLLKKNEQAHIENGDIIGLIMQKPQCQELIFGFQLLTE